MSKTQILLVPVLFLFLWSVSGQQCFTDPDEVLMTVDMYINIDNTTEDLFVYGCEGNSFVGLCQDVVTTLRQTQDVLTYDLDATQFPLQELRDVDNSTVLAGVLPAGGAQPVYNASTGLWELRSAVPLLPYLYEPRLHRRLGVTETLIDYSTHQLQSLDMVIGSDGLPLLAALGRESLGQSAVVLHCETLSCSRVDSVTDLSSDLDPFGANDQAHAPNVRALVQGDGLPLLVFGVDDLDTTSPLVHVVHCDVSLDCSDSRAVTTIDMGDRLDFNGRRQFLLDAVVLASGYTALALVGEEDDGQLVLCQVYNCSVYQTHALTGLTALAPGDSVRHLQLVATVGGGYALLVGTATTGNLVDAVTYGGTASFPAPGTAQTVFTTAGSVDRAALMHMHVSSTGHLEIFRGDVNFPRLHCTSLFHCGTGTAYTTSSLFTERMSLSAAETTDGRLYVAATPSSGFGTGLLLVCGGPPGSDRCDLTSVSDSAYGTGVRTLSTRAGQFVLDPPAPNQYVTSRVRIGVDGVPVVALIEYDSSTAEHSIAVYYCGNTRCSAPDPSMLSQQPLKPRHLRVF